MTSAAISNVGSPLFAIREYTNSYASLPTSQLPVHLPNVTTKPFGTSVRKECRNPINVALVKYKVMDACRWLLHDHANVVTISKNMRRRGSQSQPVPCYITANQRSRTTSDPRISGSIGGTVMQTAPPVFVTENTFFRNTLTFNWCSSTCDAQTQSNSWSNRIVFEITDNGRDFAFVLPKIDRLPVVDRGNLLTKRRNTSLCSPAPHPIKTVSNEKVSISF